ncbi:hypothetical protein AYX13_05201 [Cryptococcus neoformans]|nr:hypothetical protein AYX13_05201 [Cryptococcus neoformans var. grubii]
MTPKLRSPTTSPQPANIFTRSSPKKPAAMIAAKLAIATKYVLTIIPLHAQMALVYRAACPDSLYPCVKMKWAYKSGSLHEIRTLLELEVSKYMADKHDSPTVSRGKVPATMPNSSTLTHPELTSQLADHPNLKTPLDTEHDMYALFHPPL